MIAWKEWGAAAFAEARRAKIPVVLLLSGGRTAKELEAAFVGLDGLLEGRCVTVCVDRCDRPDLDLRYADSKPVALLSDDGRLLDRFALDARELAPALKRWLSGYAPPSPPVDAPRREAWTGAVGGTGRAAVLDAGRPRAFVAALLAREQALPLGALDLLLYASAEWKDAQAARRLELELDALAGRVGKSGLMSSEVPALGPHAAVCRLLWDGFARTGRASWRQAALALCDFLTRECYEPQRRAFRHSPSPSAPIYADENARAILALQRAAAFEPTYRYGQTTADALATLQADLYDPMLGMLHRRQEGGAIVYGLLGDAAWTLLAFTESFQVTGHKPHREFADGLARFLFQELWDRDGGGFLDRVAQQDDVGLLKKSRLARPEDNAAAFEGLWRLHHLKGNFNYRRWLEWGLTRFAAVSAPEGAGVARVQDMLARGRIDLELVGRPGEPAADALLTAVERLYVPRRIVSFVDPDDQDYILAHKLEPADSPRLFGCVDLRPIASTQEPEKVGELLRGLSER